MIMATYDAFEVVIVPFPFTDIFNRKRRPALVLSSFDAFGNIARHSVMVMITSAQHKPWPLDVPIQNFESAGLPKPSIIRMKFFTLDHRLIIKKCGSLSPKDRQVFICSFGKLVNF